jgi:hypothetical protein
MLNRHNFNSSVRREHVDNWIVLFCVDWLEHCQGLWDDYRRLAMHYEDVLAPAASSWQTAAVRFAEVDCAKDKPLCNENGVEEYPTVLHFQEGKLASKWKLSSSATSLSGDISKWISQVFAAQLSKDEGNATATKAAEHQIHFNVTSFIAHLHELAGLFSWRDPATAAIGYCIIAAAVGIVVWVLGAGLELDLKTILGFAKDSKTKQWPSALLPKMPEMPQPRTIVRNSFTL